MKTLSFACLVLAALSSISGLSSTSRPVGIGNDLTQILEFVSTTVRNPEAAFPNGLCGGQLATLSGLYAHENLLLDRDIQVWLPPQYYERSRDDSSFPVLYCFDGQNAIDDDESWTGASWRLTGALTKLYQQGLIDMPIVVLLPSANGDFLPGMRRRHLEYASLTSPFAVAHTTLVAQTIKPEIDRRFRTKRDAQHTFAMGTSMGGQASVNLLLRYPDLFGGAACLSPYFGVDTIASVGASSLSGTLKDKRVYLDIGGDSDSVKVPMLDLQDHLTPLHWWNPGYFWLDTSLQSSVDAMKVALTLANVDTEHKVFPGARHNERAWSKRIHLPLLHLLGRQGSGDSWGKLP